MVTINKWMIIKMKYLGSKNRIAKHILPIMLDAANKAGITTWIEPFCGGCNSLAKVPNTFKRIGYDLNPHTIAAMTAIRDIPDLLPDNVTEADGDQIIGKPAIFGCTSATLDAAAKNKDADKAERLECQ